jgi:hypothetical protein
MSDDTAEVSVTGRSSERHPLDVFSLLAGLVFLGIGVTFLVDESTTGADADLGWIVAALLIGLGLAGALGSLVRRRPRAIPDEAPEEQAIDHEKEVAP